MDNNKALYDCYVVEYLDNNFVGLRALDFDEVFYEKRSLLPNEITKGDIIDEYRNRNTHERFFEIKQKSFEVFENNDFTEWAVFSVYKNIVCLCNLENFGEKKFVNDSQLTLNARPGDIYLMKDGVYYFDKARNVILNELYARLFDEINLDAIQNGQPDIFKQEEEKMREMEETSSNLIEQKRKDFVSLYQIDEILSKNDNETIFKLYSENDETQIISSKNLPKYSRVGDFIGITENGEVDFDRAALLKYLDDLKGIGGGT